MLQAEQTSEIGFVKDIKMEIKCGVDVQRLLYDVP